jgi:methylmalonyl-CoA mutase N-terminal domain/subunit
MRERFGATNPKAWALRFHAQTGGSTLTAQQPENNIVRVAIQALSAAAGGAQSLHTNSFDEALALPTERSAQIALRTQQILQAESGITATADPFAGSYYVEALTAELLERAERLLEEVAAQGGAVACAERGWTKGQIEDAAYQTQLAIESGEQVIVGQNAYVNDEEPEPELHRLDETIERGQCERLAAWRAARDQPACDAAIAAVLDTARTDANLLPSIRTALKLGATVGEVCEALRNEWGTFD